jgi:chemotaxis protein methyltransferase CheR
VADSDCVALLQWALPRLRLRWPGFRRVRRQVCRRIAHRRAALGLPDLAGYRRLLEERPEEWAVLDRLCRVTISRFARDHFVWAELAAEALPGLAREAAAAGRAAVRAWSAGCGAGEEPFTLAIAWQLAIAPRWGGVGIEVIATDVDDGQLARAALGEFPMGALRELPEAWRRAAFEHGVVGERLRERFRAPVRFAHHDLRATPPEGPFDLVLCRNLAFSYFDEPLQRQIAATLRSVLCPGGILVVGLDEYLPEGATGFAPISRSIYTAA